MSKHALKIYPWKTKFSKRDMGKVFWRVQYKGILIEQKIVEVYESGRAKFKNRYLTNIKDGYSINEDAEFSCSQEFGLDIIKHKSEYFTNYNKALKASKERYNREVNPNGKYRVGQYFDDIFEKFVTPEMNKTAAKQKCISLNSFNSRYLVTFKMVPVSIGKCIKK